MLAALIRAQRCSEGPDTPCWRVSRAKRALSARSAGLPTPGADTLCRSGQCRALLLARPAEGCFCRRSGARMPCVLWAAAADGRAAAAVSQAGKMGIWVAGCARK